jgi:hypothetical protein
VLPRQDEECGGDLNARAGVVGVKRPCLRGGCAALANNRDSMTFVARTDVSAGSNLTKVPSHRARESGASTGHPRFRSRVGHHFVSDKTNISDPLSVATDPNMWSPRQLQLVC